MTELATPGQLRATFLRTALVAVPAVLLLGFLSGAVSGGGSSDPWFDALVKPATYPPAATFGIVWTALYILMGLAASLVFTAFGARGRGIALGLFVIQLALNLAWSPLFFGAHQISAALVLLGVLDLMVIATVVAFARVRPAAGWLLAPYLAWILFATLLTWQFLDLNPALDGVEWSGAVERVEL